MLQEALEGGGGGCDAKDAMSLRTADSLNPGVADAHTIEGPVDPGCDVLGLVQLELKTRVVRKLKGTVVHGHCHGGGRLLVVGLGVWLSLDHLPALWGGEDGFV